MTPVKRVQVVPTWIFYFVGFEIFISSKNRACCWNATFIPLKEVRLSDCDTISVQKVYLLRVRTCRTRSFQPVDSLRVPRMKVRIRSRAGPDSWVMVCYVPAEPRNSSSKVGGGLITTGKHNMIPDPPQSAIRYPNSTSFCPFRICPIHVTPHSSACN